MKKLALCLLILNVGIICHAQESPKNTSPKLSDKQHERLNIVFFLVDDMGWSDVGYEGSQFYDTPNIDRFSKKGVCFSQAYAACSVCSPTRASIITGEYPARLHLTDYLPGRKDNPFQQLKNVPTVQHLPYGQPTLPKVLKENGYETAIFGKWHLGEDSASIQRQGFDLHIPQWNKGWPHGTYFSPYHMKGLEGGPEGEYLTDRLTDEALKWMENNKDNPFFLYLSHFAVHDPIQGRKDLVAKYNKKLNRSTSQAGPPYILEENPDNQDEMSRKELDALLDTKPYQGFSLLPHRTVKIKQHQDNSEFAAMVESVDESLGKVLAKLKELGLDDNTVVIFFSDNGGMSAANFFNPDRVIPKQDLDKRFSTSNLPLRGGKGWLYEGGIREPMIIYWPHKGEHGIKSNVPVISTDFYSTILDMAGLNPTNKENGIDGMSLVPLLMGKKKGIKNIKNRSIFWHFPQYSNHGAQSPASAIRDGDYKLIQYLERNKVQLFNLKTDPGEQQDLSQLQPKKVQELQLKLRAWRKSVNAVMPLPNPNYDSKLGWPTPSTSPNDP